MVMLSGGMRLGQAAGEMLSDQRVVTMVAGGSAGEEWMREQGSLLEMS